MPNRSQPTRGVPRPIKAANGYWYVHWSSGRRSHRQSLGTKDEVQALKTFGQWLLIDGASAANGPVDYTVADLWTVYDAKHVQTEAVVASGRATIGYAWKNLEPHFGPLLVPQVNQDAVDAYVLKRRNGKLGRPAKDITIRRELATLTAALNYCAKPKIGMIAKASIVEITMPPAGDPRDRWLKMDEMQKLLRAAREMRRGDRLSRGERFLWLGLETAARKEAILDLTWDRVDFETNTIHFDVPGRRKTKKRRASVSISSSLRPVLLRAYKERLPVKAGEPSLVLDNKSDIWNTIQFIARKAGYSSEVVGRGEKLHATGISPHVLRHTAATHMARRGVPLFVIAKVLGNTVQMVERVYAKWQNDDPSDNVDHISGGVLEPAE